MMRTTMGDSTTPAHAGHEVAMGLRGLRLVRPGRGIGWTTLALATLLAACAHQPRWTGEIDRFEAECAEGAEADHSDHSRLSDQCIPLADLPNRPRALLELGEPFLGTGTMSPGFKIPGGAVWQPAFLAFGTVRTAAQGGTFGPSEQRQTLGEAAARFDLFGNLYLTQTERVVVGLRPLDQGGSFTRFTFADPFEGDASEEGEFVDELNATIGTLFMEGDILSLFPFLDRRDTRGLDIYFSVGRQPLAFQDGILLNEDALDMVGLTRANMKIGRIPNTRLTGVFAWGEVSRHGFDPRPPDEREENSSLFGLFSEIDFRSTTMEFDAVYVLGDSITGDGIHAGFGDIRRIRGRFNNTFRVLASFPVGEETPFNTQGFLIHNQLSWTPYGNHDLWYIGAFAGIKRFRSAARGPAFGGPVGQTGILFAAPGLGRVGAALGSMSDYSVGGALGRQIFFAKTRQQIVLEVGGRVITNTDEVAGGSLFGGGARYQAAMGRRFVLVLDGSAAYDVDAESTAAFGRLELVLQL